MSSRPVIFISAVSAELRSARELVAKTLLSLGYEPQWQDIVPTKHGDLCAALREYVDESAGVIQIVGHAYGRAPREPDAEFGRVSYAQFEALYARQCGKKVWHLFIDEGFTPDAHAPEPEELGELQRQYCERVRATGEPVHSFSSAITLEALVLSLRDELPRRRRGRNLRTALVLILLSAMTAGAFHFIKDWHQPAPSQQQTQERAEPPEQKITTVDSKPAAPIERMEPPLVRPDDAEMKAKQLRDALAEAESRTTLANGLHEERKYAEAAKEHRAVVVILERAIGPENPHTLASRGQLALALRMQGKLDEAEVEDRAVLFIRERLLGPEHPDTLATRIELALLLGARGRHAAAEADFGALLEITRRVLSPDHPDAILVRSNLAIALASQGKFTDAEAQQRVVLEIEERVLGPDDPRTLAALKALAITLASEHKFAAAEKEFRIVTSEEQRRLGPDDPETLDSRNSLAGMLLNLDRSSEAETEFRALLPVMQRVLGPEHPDTLGCRTNLANALQRQRKFPEAVAEQKAVLEIQERIRGREHSDVFMSCFNLAISLDAQGKKADALAFARRAWEGQKEFLGDQHPLTQEFRALMEKLEKK
jgi:tetratricopeptide (TPR) repeat protein